MNDRSTAAVSASSPASAALVDTAKADRVVYLMKTPPVLSRCLKPSDDGSSSELPIAKVTLSIDPLASSNEEPQFTMELTSSELGNVPKCYAMEMSKDLLPMAIFSEDTQGNFSVEGKIRYKFDVRPKYEAIDSYGQLCRERTVKFNTRSRQTKMIGNDSGTLMTPMPGGLLMTKMDKKKVPVKASDTKRSRRDRGDMERILFKLFERQPNWTLRQLVQDTDQPEQFLKDLLKDLCVYKGKGANQGTYELKPEYIKFSGDPGTSTE